MNSFIYVTGLDQKKKPTEWRMQSLMKSRIPEMLRETEKGYEDKGIKETDLETAIERMHPLGKALSERLIREQYHATFGGERPPMESKTMNTKFMTIDGQRYKLTPVDEEYSAENGIASLQAGMKKIDLSAEVALDWGLNEFIRQTDGSKGPPRRENPRRLPCCLPTHRIHTTRELSGEGPSRVNE